MRLRQDVLFFGLFFLHVTLLDITNIEAPDKLELKFPITSLLFG